MSQFSHVFRDQDMTVIVDQYDPDPETNALEVSWHFEGLAPGEHDELCITDAEEDEIIAAITDYMEER